MPYADAEGVRLFYIEVGEGLPLIFVHEWGGDHRSWGPQLRYFARRYRSIAFSARGYPPSDVPTTLSAYFQPRAVDDIKAILDHLGVARAHVCGLSMGAYATLLFGLTYPERALSITVAGGGYGSGADQEQFRAGNVETAGRLEREGMGPVADSYARNPTRTQFLRKDPVGWQEFRDHLAEGSAIGRALTLRGVQLTRPSVYELEARLERCEVPALILVGDEDDPAVEPSLFLKRKIPGAGLIVFANTGHTINLEEPELFNRVLLDFLTAVDAGRWPRRRARV